MLPRETKLKVKNFNLLLASIVFSLTLLGFVGFQFFYGRDKTAEPQSPISEAVLEREAARLVGKEMEIEAGLGKSGPVLFVYLEKNCLACKTELRMISAMKPSRVTVVGIMQADSGTIDAYRTSNNIEFEVLRDPDGKIAESLGIRYFPTNLFVEDGVVKKASFGSFASDRAFDAFVQND